MKIIKILSQHRNDATFLLKCENCGHEARDENGYLDNFYMTKVVSSIKCKDCGVNTQGDKENLKNVNGNMTL